MNGDMLWAALVGMYAMCPLTVVPLCFMTAPYGKHLRSGWGPTIPAPLAWFLMESPSLWLTLLLLITNSSSTNWNWNWNWNGILSISLFLLHYTHRTLIFPLRLVPHSTKRVPLSIALLAFFFNIHNAYLQTTTAALLLLRNQQQHVTIWIWIRTAVGLIIFFCGMYVNVSSDLDLLRMKKQAGGTYVLPRGGWFELVCSPNYAGEVAEWFGWMILTCSSASLAFFLYTCSNLIPRARSNLIWYRNKFKDDFPSSRKAIIPFLY